MSALMLIYGQDKVVCDMGLFIVFLLFRNFFFFLFSFFFFFNDTATTEIYTLSLHDALPILTVEKCQ